MRAEQTCGQCGQKFAAESCVADITVSRLMGQHLRTHERFELVAERPAKRLVPGSATLLGHVDLLGWIG